MRTTWPILSNWSLSLPFDSWTAARIWGSRHLRMRTHVRRLSSLALSIAWPSIFLGASPQRPPSKGKFLYERSFPCVVKSPSGLRTDMMIYALNINVQHYCYRLNWKGFRDYYSGRALVQIISNSTAQDASAVFHALSDISEVQLNSPSHFYKIAKPQDAVGGQAFPSSNPDWHRA